MVSAFGRMVRDRAATAASNIVYDDTPIHIFMTRIHQGLVRSGRLALGQLFEPGMHKSAMVGIFLAVLELTRHHNVSAHQSDLHGEIMIVANEGFREHLDISNIDDYNPHNQILPTGDPGSMVE